MSNGAWLVIFLFSVAGFFAALGSAPFWSDRFVVWVLRTSRIFAYPNAIRLAVSLEHDTAEWEFGTCYAKHTRIGSVRITSVDSVCLHLDENSTAIWAPNWIERRIIWDALARVAARRIDTHLSRTLPA